MSQVTYQSVSGLVKYMSRKFGAVGHYALDPEELEAEGRMIFAKILIDQPDLPDANFLLWFKTSLYNHYKSMLDKYRYSAKRGYEAGTEEEDHRCATDTYIDLSDVADTLGYDDYADVYYREYVESMFQLLAHRPDTLRLFKVCIASPAELEDLAINESKRKAYISKQGHLVRHAEVVRVKHKHLAEYLGWSGTKVADHLQLLQAMAKEVIYGPDQNGSKFAV